MENGPAFNAAGTRGLAGMESASTPPPNKTTPVVNADHLGPNGAMHSPGYDHSCPNGAFRSREEL